MPTFVAPKAGSVVSKELKKRIRDKNDVSSYEHPIVHKSETKEEEA